MSLELERAVGRLEGQTEIVICKLDGLSQEVREIAGRPCRNAARLDALEEKYLVSKGWILGAVAVGALSISVGKYAVEKVLNKIGG